MKPGGRGNTSDSEDDDDESEKNKEAVSGSMVNRISAKHKDESVGGKGNLILRGGLARGVGETAGGWTDDTGTEGTGGAGAKYRGVGVRKGNLPE